MDDSTVHVECGACGSIEPARIRRLGCPMSPSVDVFARADCSGCGAALKESWIEGLDEMQQDVVELAGQARTQSAIVTVETLKADYIDGAIEVEELEAGLEQVLHL